MDLTFGAVLKQARQVRKLSAGEVARAAGISAAYMSRLENDGVKRPSPNVLYRLSETLALPYSELMRLNGYRLTGEAESTTTTIAGALFADLTDDERDELLEYLAWYRARRDVRAGPRRSG